MLTRCIFASRRPKALTGAAFRALLAQARKSNAKHGITGVLLATNDAFIQVLEGSRFALSLTYNQIAADKRHADVTLLGFGEIPQRSFENWSLGEVTIEQLNPAIILKHSARHQIDPFTMSGPAVLALLNDVVASGTVI